MNYLFIGNQPQLKNKAIDDKKRTLLDPAHEALNLNLFHMGDDDSNLIKDALYTLPFVSRTRLVIIKNFHRVSSRELESILSYLEKPAKTTCLILDADRDFEKRESFPHIARFVKVRRFDRLAGNDLNAWINKELSKTGKRMEPAARELLKELVGDDLDTFKKELEKLDIFTGKNPEICKKDVELLIGKSKRDSIFDLADAILKKDIKGALPIIHGLFLNGQRPHEILGLLAWQFRILLKAKQMLEEGLPPSNLARHFNVRNSFMKKIIKVCPDFSPFLIERNLEFILSKDVDIKKGKVASPELALELLLVELCRD